ncbi:MAG TPA: BA14K family protein [Methyloceanibacter sp.]|nr:BA14K family protein [Methyloceanibacter sp.]
MPAEAGRGRGHGWKGGHGGRYVQNNYYGRRGGDNWNALGAGLVGLGVGAVIGSALTPREVVVAPPPRPYRPVGYRPQPWTDDWYAYCGSRYRSFNPRSGTYRGYDGYEHFCR